MTILCIFLLCFSLITLGLFQCVTDKSNDLVKQLNNTLELNARLNNKSCELERENELLVAENRDSQALIESLKDQVYILKEGNLENQELIDSLTDEIRGYKDGDFISSDTLEDIHSDLTCYVDNLRDNLSNLECSISDIESELSRLDGLL